mgnify:CR=1 FL=1
MKIRIHSVTIITMFLTISLQGLAQDTTQQSIRIYLDCEECSFSFFRRNIPFAEFVRAQQLADINVLVTSQRTGAGGRTFFFNFTGKNRYKEINYRLKFVSETFFTEVQRRDGLLKTLKLGLVPYLLESDISMESLDLEYENGTPSTGLLTQNPDDDPWDYWVFRIYGTGSISVQEQQSSYEIRSGLNADRITEKFKFRFDSDYSINVQEFEDDDEIITSRIFYADADFDGVYSLGPRWSLGAFLGYQSSTFSNIEHNMNLRSGLEYNIFEWDESDRRVFTVSYRVGYLYNDYIEQTIFNKTEEHLNTHQFESQFILRKNWGEIEAQAVASTFMQDVSKYRLSLGANASVRLTKVISLWSGIEAESINDQIFLPAGDLSTEDILLQQKQLQTNFNFGYELGISLTFGSIYNNVVNPRF